MVDPLRNRVVLVTGASGGIGLATTRQLVEAGARVHAVDFRGDATRERLGEQIAEGRVTPHALDVTDAAAVDLVFAATEAEGMLDAVILCAGTNVPERRFYELSEENWRKVLATNLDGVFSCVRAALPQLRATQGHAVVIASVSALWPDWSGAAYQASKAGVLALVRAASYEEHERGVRFTAILPGMVRTELLNERPDPPPEAVQAAMLRPEDVAQVILMALRLPPRACLSEVTIVPTQLQAVGKT